MYIYIYILDILFVCFPDGLSKWKGVWGTSRVPKFHFVGPLKVANLLPTSPSPALHQPFTPPTGCVFFEGTPFFRVVFFKGTPRQDALAFFCWGFPGISSVCPLHIPCPFHCQSFPYISVPLCLRPTQRNANPHAARTLPGEAGGPRPWRRSWRGEVRSGGRGELFIWAEPAFGLDWTVGPCIAILSGSVALDFCFVAAPLKNVSLFFSRVTEQLSIFGFNHHPWGPVLCPFLVSTITLFGILKGGCPLVDVLRGKGSPVERESKRKRLPSVGVP